MDILSNWLLIFFSHMLYIIWVRAELSDDLFDLNPLLETENTLLDTMKNFLQDQEAQLTAVKQQLKLFSTVHEQVKNNSPQYLSNPINRFLFIRRLTHEKRQMEILLKQARPFLICKHFSTQSMVRAKWELQSSDLHLLNNLASLQEKINFPSEQDLNSATSTLLYLQQTYKLDTQSVSRGEINGIKWSPELSADECFELGEQGFVDDDYKLAVSWLREALRKYDINPKATNILKWEILNYLAYSVYELGNISEAFELTEEVLSVNPECQVARDNLQIFEELLKNENTGVENEEHGNSEITETNATQILSQIEVIEANKNEYLTLCRGEVELPIHVRSTMKCRYVNKGKPFLFIAPLKEEEAYLNPRIVLYREVLHDTEIETIKNLATPNLQHAKVISRDSDSGETSSVRISKSAWLLDDQHPLYQKVMRQVEDMTSLSSETVEGIQVANYGIGGHYKTHYDFFQESSVRDFNHNFPGSDRIATVLFYLNDVKQGGATVFPFLNLGVWPQKGTAVLWYNLHTSGAADFDMFHAACPVLLGFKWVATVWIREEGQVFFRPCNPSDNPNVDLSANL